MMKNLLRIATTSFAAAGCASAATVTLTNADFQDGEFIGGVDNITGWVENDPNTFDSNYTSLPVNIGGGVTKGGSAAAATDIFGSLKAGDDNWIAQSLTVSNEGALDASTFGEFTISFQLGARSDAGQFNAGRTATVNNIFNDLRFALWDTTAGAELAGQTISLADPGAVGTALTAQTVNLTYDNSTVTAGNTLQFRITNLAPTPSLGNELWQRTAIVDDFAIEAVPEPSSLMLLALSGLALTARRRK